MFRKEFIDRIRELEFLEDKTKFVDWNNEERVEHFWLIAKRLEGKGNLIDARYLCYALEDLEKSACAGVSGCRWFYKRPPIATIFYVTGRIVWTHCIPKSITIRVIARII